MKINSIITAEITSNCIKAHAGDVERTVDDALNVVREELLKTVGALKGKKFSPGVVIHVGYGMKYPEPEGGKS